MSRPEEQRPQSVPEQRAQAQQGGDIRARWEWVEPTVWTSRMLTALEKGVEGGKWFRLFDKVFAKRNLEAGFRQVARNDGSAGVDHVTVRRFEQQLDQEISQLSEQIRTGRYRPQAIRRVHIPKPGTHETRALGIPTVRDRVAQAAIVNVIEPIFESQFAEHSYGFRPGRGCKDALRRVDQLLKQGCTHVVDADLKSYFDTIPHERLMDRLKEKIADGPVLKLIESFLKADIMEEAARWTPQAGAPQGAVLSPLLSNVYLDSLDHQMARAGYEMVRYADDFVILCPSAQAAEAALELVSQWVTDNGLTLHPTKTRIVDSSRQSFVFLGYVFWKQTHRPSDKSMKKLKDALRVKTRRSSGQSMALVIHNVNRTLRGWFEYFKHTRAWVFAPLDRWLRQRLRSILRKRSKRRGCARGGNDNLRWGNAYFARLGLMNLVKSRSLAGQSS